MIILIKETFKPNHVPRRITDMAEQLPELGQLAPDFSLPASVGPTPMTREMLQGKIAVLAFYILDFTGG